MVALGLGLLSAAGLVAALALAGVAVLSPVVWFAASFSVVMVVGGGTSAADDSGNWVSGAMLACRMAMVFRMLSAS